VGCAGIEPTTNGLKVRLSYHSSSFMRIHTKSYIIEI